MRDRLLRNDVQRMLTCILLLAGVGLVAGVSVAPPGEGLRMLGLHCVHLSLGLAAFLLALSLPVERVRQALPGMLVALFLVLLAMLLIPGFGWGSHGAVRWLRIGPLVLQPSVLLQCLWPAAVASWVARDPLRFQQPRELWRLIGVFGLLMVPVLLQPDLGSVIILAVATALILLFAGAPFGFLRQLVPLLVLAILLALLLFNHVDARLSSFIHHSLGFQAVRAHQAFARGGLAGTGPGLGTLKNGFVPEGDTDYILALIGEEWGFLGTFSIWFLYVSFTFFGVRAARSVRHRYGAILLAAATLMVALQAALNLAVVTDIAPPKGLPLPFVSRGGSSILALSGLLGLAVRAARVRTAPSSAPACPQTP